MLDRKAVNFMNYIYFCTCYFILIIQWGILNENDILGMLRPPTYQKVGFRPKSCVVMIK